MTAPSSPRIAVLGCGAWGMNHVRVWHRLGSLQAVCDSDTSRLAQVADEFAPVETFADPEAVFADPTIDAVVLATPAVTHAELALRAIESGKDVLVEKPLATALGEAEKVLAVAERERAVLMVGHVLEYHPATLALRRLVEEGELGKLLYLYSHRLNFGRVRTEENALWSFAPHDIALLIRLLGAMPLEVSCRGGAFLSEGVADTTVMNLKFPGPIQAHIFVSWLHPFKEHRFVVVGDRQMAVFDDTAPWGEKLVLYPNTVEWRGGQVPVARKAEAVPVPLEEGEPLLAECEQFLECITARRAPLTDGTSGLRVLRVLDAGERSLQKGGAPTSMDGRSGSPEDLIHPTAVVDVGAELGEGARVWHYSHVMAGARVGREAILGQNVFVGPGVSVGAGVKVQNNVSLYEGVELEDFVFCGPSAVFTNVINPRSEIERKSEFRRTLVRRGATIGANATIVCGTTLGRYSFVAAGAVVTKDVPEYALVAGVPARLMGWVCECGARLTFQGGESRCDDCRREYRQTEPERIELHRGPLLTS